MFDFLNKEKKAQELAEAQRNYNYADGKVAARIDPLETNSYWSVSQYEIPQEYTSAQRNISQEVSEFVQDVSVSADNMDAFDNLNLARYHEAVARHERDMVNHQHSLQEIALTKAAHLNALNLRINEIDSALSHTLDIDVEEDPCITRPASTRPFSFRFLWLLALVLDAYVLYSFFDAFFNGSLQNSILSTAGVTFILDLYSGLLSEYISKFSERKRRWLLGGALAGIIGIIAVLSVLLRLVSGNLSEATDVVTLSTASTNIGNLLMSLVPIGSTIFVINLTAQKQTWDRWDKRKKLREEQNILKGRAYELEHSMSESGKISPCLLNINDIDAKSDSAERQLALAQYFRGIAESRVAFAREIDDEAATKRLSEEQIFPSEMKSDILAEVKIETKQEEVNNENYN